MINQCLKTLKIFRADPSLCLSYTLKNEIKQALKELKTPHLNKIDAMASDIHHTLTRTNSLNYEIAKLTGTTHAQVKNLNYGILGLSLMLFFGSVTLSIHPIFISGVLVGVGLYSKIAKQSSNQYNSKTRLETLINENKMLNSKLVNQIDLLESELEKLKIDNN